jgi:hypothetical protein
MKAKVGGVLLVIVAILAIIIAAISGKNESIIMNLGFPAFIVGIFLAFLNS